MKRLLFFLPLIFAFVSCNIFSEGIRGNGVIKSENRKEDSFNAISVSGNIRVYITQGTTYSVRIETDENLMEFIETRTNGNVLKIKPKDNHRLSPSRDIKVYVTSPSYKELHASGACYFYSENKISSSGTFDIGLSGESHIDLSLNAPKVLADLSGASSIELSGETKDFDLNSSGSSDIKAFDLKAESVDIDISGAGEAEVFASVNLDVHISGAGSVRYKGNPSVNQSISGAGIVQKAE